MPRQLLLVLALSFLSVAASTPDSLPAGEDIGRLADETRQTADTFMQESRKLRLAYDYSGRFLSHQDREQLHELAKDALEHLTAVAERQQRLKGLIEEYDGDDWDERYGSTGLWRKVFADLYVTKLNEIEIEIWIALCSGQSAQDELLRGTLGRIDSLRDEYKSTAYLQLPRAKTLALLGRADPGYKASAQREFDLLTERSDMQQATAFRIGIERIRLLGPSEADRLSQLTGELAQSSCAENLEPVLSLAVLQRRCNRVEAFEKTLRTWPQIGGVVGSLILSDLSWHLGQARLDTEQVTVLDAELAAQAAWQGEPAEYKALLEKLADTESLQRPLVLYVAAAVLVESSPQKSYELLKKAARLQSENPDTRLDIPAVRIAEQAVCAACNMYTAEQCGPATVIEAFEGYRHLSDERPDDRLQYAYAVALTDAGREKEGDRLLEEMAAGGTKPWCNRARLELLKGRIRRDDPNDRGKIQPKVLALIDDCGRDPNSSAIRIEAMGLYCRGLLESREEATAKQALTVLTDTDIAADPNLAVFKSRALRYLNRLEESADCLARVCEAIDREYVIEAEGLLREIIGRVEEVQGQATDPPALIDDSLTIGRYCRRVAGSTYGLVPVDSAGLYLAEILLLSATTDQQKLAEAEEFLDDIPDGDRRNNPDFLRCRARLLTARGRSHEAAGVWAQLAAVLKARTASSSNRSPQWWRAKFYELDCMAKTSKPRTSDLLHAIDVLESSFAEIPSFWADKLRLLRQSLR